MASVEVGTPPSWRRRRSTTCLFANAFHGWQGATTFQAMVADVPNRTIRCPVPHIVSAMQFEVQLNESYSFHNMNYWPSVGSTQNKCSLGIGAADKSEQMHHLHQHTNTDTCIDILLPPTTTNSNSAHSTNYDFTFDGDDSDERRRATNDDERRQRRKTTSNERRRKRNDDYDQRPTMSDDERPTTTNKERRQRPTTHDGRRATNDQRPTTNDQRPTTNDERRTTNDEQRTTNDVQSSKFSFSFVVRRRCNVVVVVVAKHKIQNTISTVL